MQKPIHLRNLDKADLPSIINIEERVTGVARPDYWEKRIEVAEAIRPHWASLVAERDIRVVAFILGRSAARSRADSIAARSPRLPSARSTCARLSSRAAEAGLALLQEGVRSHSVAAAGFRR